MVILGGFCVDLVFVGLRAFWCIVVLRLWYFLVLGFVIDCCCFCYLLNLDLWRLFAYLLICCCLVFWCLVAGLGWGFAVFVGLIWLWFGFDDLLVFSDFAGLWWWWNLMNIWCVFRFRVAFMFGGFVVRRFFNDLMFLFGLVCIWGGYDLLFGLCFKIACYLFCVSLVDWWWCIWMFEL